MSDNLLSEILARLRVEKGPSDRGDYIAWCVFHKDGEGASPHAPNLSVGPRGFICHACGEQGSLKELAVRLGLIVQRSSVDPEAVYDYVDERGILLFQVVRFPGKSFRQRRPNGKGGWIGNLDGVRRVLYRLPELLARQGDPVHIVEGERDAERLASQGLVATTNPGGAGKWRREYSEFLVGRDVVIHQDNDDAGRKHSRDVAAELVGNAKSIKMLDLPGLPAKGDVSNWLDAGHSVSDLLELVDQTPPWVAKEATSDSGGEGGRSESQAAALVDLALESGIELFHEEREEPYARVTLGGRSRVLPIDSRRFGRFLNQLAWSDLGKSPGSEVLSSAARTLGSIACLERPQIPLSVRHARHEGDIYIDLDGTRAVRVGPTGWGIVEAPPILFRSFQHQRPLPDPIQGGDAELVLDFVNLPNDDARTLFINHLVTLFDPDVPIAALAVHGVQGSAKSSLFRVVRRCVDPSGVEVRGGVKDATELAQALFHNRILILDNLSGLPNWVSDALCGAITGDGWAKRALYTNEDDVYFQYRRVICIGGINLVVQKADLLDRCVLLELHLPPREARREEQEFWTSFEAARAKIFGGLLDRLAKTMAVADGLSLRNLPRMADYCRWGEASAQASGQRPEMFLAAYDRNVNRQSDVAIDASPVGEAVVILASRNREWTGTPARLYEELSDIAQGLRINTRGKAWPKAAHIMTRRLKEVEAPLLTRGISVVTTRSGSGRMIKICAGPASSVTSVTAVTGLVEGSLSPDSCDAARQPVASPIASPAIGVAEAPGSVPDSSDASDATSGEARASQDDELEERAAIREFDGGETRAVAEAAARATPSPLSAEAGGWW